MIGSIGSGKSSTSQSICDFKGIDTFKTSARGEPCTLETDVQRVKWKETDDEYMNKEEFILIDTPGFNEGDESDMENISNMIIRLRNIKIIDAIFIVINS